MHLHWSKHPIPIDDFNLIEFRYFLEKLNNFFFHSINWQFACNSIIPTYVALFSWQYNETPPPTFQTFDIHIIMYYYVDAMTEHSALIYSSVQRMDFLTFSLLVIILIIIIILIHTCADHCRHLCALVTIYRVWNLLRMTREKKYIENSFVIACKMLMLNIDVEYWSTQMDICN